MFYPILQSKRKLGGKIAKNRLVMSPMGECMANTDGSVSEQMISYYARRAQGGTGIIIPGVISVEFPRGKTSSVQSRLDQTPFIKDFSRLAYEIHRYGALLIPQIMHAGAATDIRTTEGETPISITEDTSLTDNTGAHVSSTEVEVVQTHIVSTEEIKELEQKFITCAINAQQANCDGVELHGAHSYLIAQFLHSGINNRTDEYGGSIENRARFAYNIIKGIREACGPDFIIGSRIPVHMWPTDGLTDEETITMVKMFEEAGCDFLDCSGGIPLRPSQLIDTEHYEQGWRVTACDKIREHVSIDIMALGNIREPEVAEKILSDGRADFVIMGRQLICDPDYMNKINAGQPEQIRKCISCSKGCYGELSQNRHITCALNPEAGYEFFMQKIGKQDTPKKVMIIGGGVAGMQAAITAVERGNEAIIYEMTDKLGGQVDIASKGPYKERIQWVNDYFIGEVKRKQIKVVYNKTATLDDVKKENPDKVIVATGSKPFNPNIEGVDTTVAAWDVLNGYVALPENGTSIVLGGGIVGCEIAEMLAEKGNQTTVLEMTSQIATGLEPFHRLHLLANFEESDNLNVLTDSVVTKITSKNVSYKHGEEEKTIEGDFIVSALGQKPVNLEIVEDLEKDNICYEIVGDANKPDNFRSATRQAYNSILNL